MMERERSSRGPGGRSEGRGRPGAGPRGARSGGPGGRRRPFARKKICRFRANKITWIDYKDTELLRRYITEKGKIIPRKTTGTSAKYQRMLARAIKKARHAGLLPFQEL